MISLIPHRSKPKKLTTTVELRETGVISLTPTQGFIGFEIPRNISSPIGINGLLSGDTFPLRIMSIVGRLPRNATRTVRINLPRDFEYLAAISLASLSTIINTRGSLSSIGYTQTGSQFQHPTLIRYDHGSNRLLLQFLTLPVLHILLRNTTYIGYIIYYSNENT